MFYLLRTLTLGASLAAQFAFAQTPVRTQKIEYVGSNLWTTDRIQLKSSLTLKADDEIIFVSPSPQTLVTRIKRYSRNPTIDPVSITLKKDDDYLWEKATRLAKTGKEKILYRHFREYIDDNSDLKLGEEKRYVVKPQLLDLIDKDALAGIFNYTHHQVAVYAQQFKTDRDLETEFFDQLKPFIEDDIFIRNQQKLAQGIDLKMEEDLLPPFAKKMVKNFIAYRGPNCFHASLAFQNPIFTRSQLFNVAEEKGYHRSMINYDELWRTLQSTFYEIDPHATNLKYGDILVFFDLPERHSSEPLSFKWIRHTATYLFNSFTFSKGSKSANTPYVIKTLSEEWDSWTRNTSNLAVKVFRQGTKNVTKRPPKDLEDWLY